MEFKHIDQWETLGSLFSLLFALLCVEVKGVAAVEVVKSRCKGLHIHGHVSVSMIKVTWVQNKI